MALDDKQSGQKWYAFELNNILKEIRQIVANILSLNASAHWEFISSNSGAPQTAPANANFAIMQIAITWGGTNTDYYSFVLSKASPASFYIQHSTSSGYYYYVTITWSGNTVTAVSGGNSGSIGVASLSGFYYS